MGLERVQRTQSWSEGVGHDISRERVSGKHDYMAIPGLTCLAEQSFSMSTWTDNVQHRQMDGVMFGSL